MIDQQKYRLVLVGFTDGILCKQENKDIIQFKIKKKSKARKLLNNCTRNKICYKHNEVGCVNDDIHQNEIKIINILFQRI